MKGVTLPSDAETQALERIKRVVAHEREQKDEFMSLRPKSQLVCGLNATLRVLQKGEAKLLVIPAKSPMGVMDVVTEIAQIKACPIWCPSTSSIGLGRVVGFKSSPCAAVAFVGDGDSADPLTSIRDFVLKQLGEKADGKDVADGKRLKLASDGKGS